MIWRKLVILLMMAIRTMGIKVISENVEFTEIGDKMEIRCYTDEQPEFCSFLRYERIDLTRKF